METFYFNGATGDGDWQTLGNWWMDSAFTTPATSLPTSADDVIASENIWLNSGSEPTVANFTLNDPANVYLRLNIPITVTDTATFNDTSYNYGTVTGDCVFNNLAGHAGAISGNCIFNDYSFATFWAAFNGAIYGDCTFNDNSSCSSNLWGNCTFNGSSSIIGYSTITGNCTFNDTSHNRGTVYGDCVFNDNATNYLFLSFMGGYLEPGIVDGNCTFSLSSAALHIDQTLTRVKQLSSPMDASDPITGNIDFKYEKGINGSSILGVV